MWVGLFSEGTEVSVELVGKAGILVCRPVPRADSSGNPLSKFKEGLTLVCPFQVVRREREMGSAWHAAVLNRRLSVSGDERSGCTLPSSVPPSLLSLPLPLSLT